MTGMTRAQALRPRDFADERISRDTFFLGLPEDA